MNINYSVVNVDINEIRKLDELKNYLRISHDYDDSLIQDLFQAAIEYAENFIGISINTKTILVNINNAAREIKLKYPRIVNINSIHVCESGKKDITGNYGYLDRDTNLIYFNTEYVGKDLAIEFISGYGNARLPSAITQGIIMHLAAMYEHNFNTEIDYAIKKIYSPYRLMKI